MFKKAGYNVSVGSRSYFPYIDDEGIGLVLLRAQELSRYVQDGALDCGITGEDWIQENGSDVVRVKELIYAKTGMNPVRWVLAVPEDSPIKKIKDLEGKRIATELKGFTEKYLKDKGVKADVEFSWGATEVKVGSGLVDAIVELTETGSSLRANKLRIVETLCYSTTQFITNKKTWENPAKKRKMQHIALLLQGAINSEAKVGLKMNVQEKFLRKIISLLPAMKNPTISNLAGDLTGTKEKWYDVDTIVDERIVRDLIPKLKEAGAEGIVEYPLNKVID